MTDFETDLAAAREKYRAERDKRVAGTNRESFIPTRSGVGARFIEDPHLPVTEREPVHDEVDATVVGAGFGGLMIAAYLKMQGVARVRLIDTAGDVGGVWYWNRYPGAMCDVESLIYMPMLEETDYVPSMRYAGAAEIAEHAQRIAHRFGLYENALFHTEVESLHWDETAGRWDVRTNRGDQFTSRFTLLALGPLSRVKLPALPGLDTFRGSMFHTSRWDYEYTGGGPAEPLTGLRDKRVGVVGTGATGLQCVPPLGRDAQHLYVFQRTPSTVAVRDNRPIDQDEVRAWEPGWQKRRQTNFTHVLAGIPVEEDLVADGWTDLYGHLTTDPYFKTLPEEEAARARELADFNQMESVRRRIDQVVRDAGTAELLKPQYAYLCKRPGFHDEYLDTFNRPNVTLVDTDGQGLECVYEDGVVVNGEKYPLDCLVLATGFESETAGKLRWGIDIVGRDGLSLPQKWANGMSTFFGILTRGFPNLLILPAVNGQSTVTSNLIFTLQHNAEHMGHIVGETMRRGLKTIEPTASAEAEYVEMILDRAIDRTAFLEACTPGRTNYEGHVDGRPKQNANYCGTPPEFFAMLKKWRDDGDMAGLEVTPLTGFDDSHQGGTNGSRTGEQEGTDHWSVQGHRQGLRGFVRPRGMCGDPGCP